MDPVQVCAVQIVYIATKNIAYIATKNMFVYPHTYTFPGNNNAQYAINNTQCTVNSSH